MSRASSPRMKVMTATWRAKFVVALGGAIVGFGILGTGAALAYWLTASSNPGEAVAASLSAPTTPNATVNGSGAITIGWVLPATQLPGAQYEVTRTSGPGNPALVCTVAATVTSCQDSGLIAATSYGYSVVAVLDDWQSSALTTSATTATPTFAISLSASPYTVGTPITVQAITAKIGASTDTTYTGAKTINWSGLASSPSGQAPAYPSGSMSFINGVASPGATFTAYRAGSNSLTATDANASSVTGTATIAVNASAAAQIAVVSGSGQSATVNTAFANPLVALVTDSYGNPVAGTSVTFAGPSSGAGGIFGSSGCTSNPQTYSCVATTNASGDATSSAFAASTVAGGPYNVSASAAGTNTVNFSETDTAGSAATIAFTSTVSGNRTVSSSASVGPFVVQVQDSFGNAVTNTGPAATVSLTTTSAGMGGHTPFFTTTSGGSSASAVTIANGASSSPSFYYSDTKAGNPTINATATVNSQPVTGSTNGVTMVAATASKLAITSTAFSAAASSSATNGFATTLEDSFGNATTNGSAITIGLSSSSSGAKFAASSGGAGVTNVTLSANTQSLTAYYGDTVAGSPTITVSGSGLSPNGTQTETITAATANNYVFLTSAVSGQASASASVGPITVQEQDTFGNPTTTAETVTLSSSSAGTYIFNTTENATSPTGSTTVSIPAGQSSATFYYGDTKTGGPLIIASGSLTSATQTETITPGALSQLALNPSTSSPTAGTGFTVSLTALDQYGNTDTNYTGSECVAFSGPASSPGGTAPSYPAKGSCASGSAMTFTNGAATGSNAANITLYDAQSVTLTATDNTTSKTGSTSLVVGPATVTKLVFSTEPVGGVAEGTNFATEPVVSVEDSYSNTVTSDTGSVALSIGSYTAGNGGSTEGSLGCTANTVNAVAGVATFASCQITGTAGAGTYVLSAARSGLTTGTSSNVAITAGSATKLVFSTEPVGGSSGTTWTTQPAVTVEDASGNTVTASSASISLAINTSPGGGAVLSCTNNPLSATSGVATFAGCKIIGQAGSYALSATATSLTTATSSSFSLTGIAFVQQVSIPAAAAVSSVSPTLSSGVTAGDALILVFADQADNGSAVSSVSGGGVTWEKAVSSGASTTYGVAEVWYGLDSTGTSGSTVITVNLSATTNVQIADVSEWKGIATTGALDTDTSDTGASTSISAGAITPSASGELIISDAYLSYANTSQPTPSNGFSSFTQNHGESGYYRGYGAYLVDGTSSSISTTWTEPGSGDWSAAIAAFKP